MVIFLSKSMNLQLLDSAFQINQKTIPFRKTLNRENLSVFLEGWNFVEGSDVLALLAVAKINIVPETKFTQIRVRLLQLQGTFTLKEI